jgi:hypothetical protein
MFLGDNAVPRRGGQLREQQDRAERHAEPDRHADHHTDGGRNA